MEGTVQGGWGYVAAAYGLSWALWVIYGLVLIYKSRNEQ